MANQDPSKIRKAGDGEQPAPVAPDRPPPGTPPPPPPPPPTPAVPDEPDASRTRRDTPTPEQLRDERDAFVRGNRTGGIPDPSGRRLA